MKTSSVIFIYFVLAVSTLLVFWQVRNFEFVNYDDHEYVSENQHVLRGLSSGSVIWAFTTCHLGYWQPLTWLSLMLDCQLSGSACGWIHLVNVLFHLANTLLLFAVLAKMTDRVWPSAFVAAAFALHPMHVESVAWIAERKDVLSTLFFLLTLAAYVGYVRRPSLPRYLLAILLFIFGLLAKPMLVTLPFVLLLLDYWPLNRLNAPQIITSSAQQSRKPAATSDRRRILYRIIIEKIPFFVLSAVSSVITFLTQQAGGLIVDIKKISLGARIGNAFLSYVVYIGKMFWPQNLAVFYPPDIAVLSLLPVALCALLLLVVSVFVIGVGQKQKYLLVGWFWFIGTLIPVIGLVKFTGSSYADRFTYIPYIGLFIMFTWGLAELFTKWPYRKIAFGALMVTVLVAMGIVSYRQASYWKNGFTLFSHALEVTQNNPVAYNNFGVACGKLGRHQEAIEACKQAILIKPGYAEAYNNLIIAYGNLGRYQEATEACKQVILIRPDYVEAYYKLGILYTKLARYPEALEAFNHAIKLKPNDAKIYLNLGSTYNSAGNSQQAVDAYKHCLKIDPSNAEAYNKLGGAFVNLRQYDEAIDAYKKALEINPSLIEVHNNLAVLLLDQKKVDEAISHLKRSLEIKPNNLMSKNNLAWIFATNGDPSIRNSSEAIRLAQEVCSATNYKNPTMLDTLGVAYASAGRFADAIEISKTALALADKAGNPKIKDDIQYHLTFYTQGKPCTETAQKSLREPNEP